MKPWYWPVTSTVYKMFIGFILAFGSTTMIDLLLPSIPIVFLGLFGFLLAMTIYVSLVKKDWL